MTTNTKLKILIAVLFCFIIILVGVLVYAIQLSKQENAVSDTTAVTTATSSSQSVSTETSVNTSQNTPETLDLRLYYFDADDYDKPKEVRTVTMDKELYQEDITAAINKLLEGTDLQIQKAAVDGDSITVDISKAEAMKFNAGSANGITRTNILAATVLNLPDISEMIVTVDREAGIAEDHYNFNGVFAKASDGKYYTFTMADNKDK